MKDLRQIESEKDYYVFPKFKADGSNYPLVVALNNSTQAFVPKEGKTTEMRIERIDVNDVSVTREDGTVYKVKGKYEVYKKVGSIWELVVVHSRPPSNCGLTKIVGNRKFSTPSGLDVWPGEYKVLVHFNTLEGSDVSEHFLDLR